MTTLDEARELARAIILDGVDGPGGKSQRLEEIERFIDELDGQVRKNRFRARARHYRTNVKLMRYDLKVDEDSLRRLVSAAWLLWRVAMDDWEMRHDPGKPKQRLSDNWNPKDVVWDYGPDTGAGLEDWDGWWREVYLGPRGRRWAGTVPLVPLYEVFYLAREWWFQNTDLGAFGLSYKERREDFTAAVWKRREDFTAAERFFLDIAQAMDARYSAEDCASVYESCRK